MAAVNATEWERNHVQAIDLLLRNCQIRNAEFNWKHHLLNQNPNAQIEAAEWLRFRSFTIDLYSVLDYICYLLFCQFQNNRQPDFSNRSRNVKFPYSDSLRRSSFEGQENTARRRRENWKENQTETIFGYGPFLQQGHYRVRDFVSAFLLNVQHIKEVDAAGNVIERNPEEGSDVESFSLLHFFRNYSAHRDVVRCRAKQGVLYININTGERVFQPQNQAPPGEDVGDAEDWQSIAIAKGFWVEYPIVRPLTKVASQLLSFVKLFRKNVVTLLTGVQYPHDVKWTWDGLTVDGQFTKWKDYDQVLNRLTP